MATTTTNYGFDIPQSTDLVKDGATAIATLGQDIDTAMNTALGTKKAGMVLLSNLSFSGVSSQSINDVFSATYDNYRIVLEINATSLNTGVNLRLRVGGVDNSSSEYLNNRLFFEAANVTSTGASTTTVSFTSIAEHSQTVGNTTVSYDVFSPFATRITNIHGVGNYRYSGQYYGFIKTGQTSVTTSFTGFTVIPAAGTITGNVSVYGYNK